MSSIVTKKTMQNEQALIDLILSKARSNGADAQITLSRRESWEVSVAKNSIEQLTSSVSLRLSLSIFLPDGRCASVSSNDLRESSINDITSNAIAMAEAGEADPYRRLPPIEKCGRSEVENIDDKGEGFNSEEMLQDLLDAESQAKSVDPRIIGFYNCSATRNRERRRLINSHNIDITTTNSDYLISIDLVAEQDGEKQIGSDFTVARNLRDLRPAFEVAKIAVKYALRGFGWKKARSGPISVVLDSSAASQLLGVVKLLACGEKFLNKRSYWADRVDTAIASDCITIVDDPLIQGGVGSRECDKEGVQAKPLTIVEKGILRSAMTDTYAAGKLNIPFTGHAGGASNLILQPGSKSQKDLLAELGTGFFVTGIQGKAIDITAGTWSKGASGFWVENGKIVHPVQGVTLAGKLENILKGVTAVGNDFQVDTDTSSPSLLILHGLTLGGE